MTYPRVTDAQLCVGVSGTILWHVSFCHLMRKSCVIVHFTWCHRQNQVKDQYWWESKTILGHLLVIMNDAMVRKKTKIEIKRVEVKDISASAVAAANCSGVVSTRSFLLSALIWGTAAQISATSSELLLSSYICRAQWTMIMTMSYSTMSVRSAVSIHLGIAKQQTHDFLHLGGQGMHHTHLPDIRRHINLS